MRVSLLFLLMLLLPVSIAAADQISYADIDAKRLNGEFGVVLESLRALPDSEGAFELLWRLSRAHYDIGRTKKQPSESAEEFNRAISLAQQAIAEAPDRAEGYKWLAISQGVLAQQSGTKQKIELSRGVRENIEKALAIEPDDDISLLVLGKWHFGVATLGFFSRTIVKVVYGGLPDASLEQSEQVLKRALAIRDRAAHRLNLAKVYVETDRNELAVAELERAIMLQPTFPHESADIEAARSLLSELRP